MAKIKLLKAQQIETLAQGFHADGANLYLRVRSATSRAWVFRYKTGGRAGRTVEIGLGSTADRKLAQARIVAEHMRNALADGRDPRGVLSVTRGPQKTFQDYAAELIEAKRAGYKSAKHVKQWQSTLAQHASSIANKRPQDIMLADVKAVLQPLWATKTETASRLRQRIEAVIDFAAVHEGTDKSNPARWKGNLDKVLPAPRKVAKVVHHATAKYSDVPAILSALREKDSTSAYCLRWTILTAARSNESRGAKWSEIDETAKKWAVPANRMKASRPHDVPLCDEAIEILEAMRLRRVDGCDYIFPGATGGLLSDVAVNKTLHAIAPDVTVHGFRSSFRVWGAEITSFPSAVLELALAHVDPNRVQSAYQQSDLFERRRELMAAWGSYCSRKSNVVSMSNALGVN